MGKVYCKNCKYFSSHYMMGVNNKWFYNNRCHRDVKLTVGYNGIRQEGNPQAIGLDNENGDCKHYKKIWYKFWVK